MLQEFAALSPAMKLNLLALTYGRVHIFAKAGSEVVNHLIASARDEVDLDPNVVLQLAKDFHQSWWQLRQAMGLSGHHGDKHWDDETPEEQANDLNLIPGWAELLSAVDDAAGKGNEEFAALMKYIRD